MKYSIFVISIILFSCTQKSTVTDKKEELYSYNVENRIKELGIELIIPPVSVANYVGAARTGNLVFLSGKISTSQEGKLIPGKLGADLTIEEGYKAARFCGIGQSKVVNGISNLMV